MTMTTNVINGEFRMGTQAELAQQLEDDLNAALVKAAENGLVLGLQVAMLQGFLYDLTREMCASDD